MATRKISEEHRRKLKEASQRRWAKQSERDKMSQAKMGSTAWNKGQALSEEHRQKLSESQQKSFQENSERRKNISSGVKHFMYETEEGIEFRKRRSEELKGQDAWNKGLKTGSLSEEHRKKISEGLKKDYKPRIIPAESRKRASEKMKGRTSPNKGKSFMSEEAKQKIREARFRQTNLRLDGNRGRKHSPEVRKKISTAIKAIYSNNPLGFGRFGKKGLHISPKAGEIHYRSSYEKRFCEVLDKDENVLTYEFESLYLSYQYGEGKNIYIPDFVVIFNTGEKKVVEIKAFWMTSHPKNIAKFSQAQKEFGDNFVIFTEHELEKYEETLKWL